MTTLLVGQTVSGMRSACDAGHQRRVLDERHAVVDPFGAENVESDRDVGRARRRRPRPRGKSDEGRADGRHRMRAQSSARSMPSSVESAPTPITRSPTPKPTELTEPLDELEAGARPVRAVDIGDQHAANVHLRLGGVDPVGQTRHDRAQVLAGGQVARRREEHLAVAKPVGGAVDERLVRDPGPVVPRPRASPGRARRPRGTNPASRSDRARPGRRPGAVGRPSRPARGPWSDGPFPRRGSAARPWGFGRMGRLVP